MYYLFIGQANINSECTYTYFLFMCIFLSFSRELCYWLVLALSPLYKLIRKLYTEKCFYSRIFNVIYCTSFILIKQYIYSKQTAMSFLNLRSKEDYFYVRHKTWCKPSTVGSRFFCSPII